MILKKRLGYASKKTDEKVKFKWVDDNNKDTDYLF